MAKKKKTSRASNGMGSIRQRSDGRWEARYTTPEGKQKSVYAKTEKEVTVKLRGIIRDIDKGTWQEPSRMTVSEWMDTWLADYLGHTSERTVVKYKCIVEGQIKPHLGKLRLVKLFPHHIQHMVTAMQADGLAPITIQNYVKILRASLQCACEVGLLTDNPTKKVKVPRVPPTKFIIIDKAEIPAFLEAADQGRYSNELKFMFYTGLRISELRGLMWSDTDLDAGTMDVQRQLHPKDHNLSRFTPPKYGEARLLHLAPEAIEILRNQRKLQAEQRLAAGPDWIEDEVCRDLVFRQPNGKAHGEKTIYTAVKNVGKVIGRPEMHPHDLRHSYAVAALRAGIDVKTVQYNLGHKKASMTLDVYASYTSDAGKDGAVKLSDYIKSAQKKPV